MSCIHRRRGGEIHPFNKATVISKYMADKLRKESKKLDELEDERERKEGYYVPNKKGD